MEPLSRGLKVLNIGASTDIDWEDAEIFIKDMSTNFTLNFNNIVDKHIRIILNNTTGGDLTITFNAIGFTEANFTDIMTRVRANQTQIYEFVADTTNNTAYCLNPLRMEAIWAP